MRFVVEGDLVYGLEGVCPPRAFVGEIGDQAVAAAREISGRLAGPQGGGPKVTVAGRRIATQRSVAVPRGPTGAPATPVTWISRVAVAGQHCLVHSGVFRSLPDSTLASVALQQPVAFTDGAGTASAHGGAAASGSTRSATRRPRTDYGAPTPAQIMISRCSSARRGDLVPPEHAFFVGDPVDVATGAVVVDDTDVRVQAPPLTFSRRYVSTKSDRDGPFGFGWSHEYDQALWLEAGRVVVRDATGREVEFDCVPLPDHVARAGDVLADPTGRQRLTCHGRHHWELQTLGQTVHFGPVPGTSGPDTDRGLALPRRIVRPGQPLIELGYDVAARLHTVWADGNEMLRFSYDAAGHILTVNRDEVRLEYSPQGDLIAATDAEGKSRRYEYVEHLLVGHTNRRGGSVYYVYDGHGCTARCVQTWGAQGQLHRVLSYESDATVVLDAAGHRTVYETDALGLVRRVLDPTGNATGYRYDDALRLVEITHPDGSSVRDVYDEDGRLAQRHAPDGATWRMRYDPAGNLCEAVDPLQGIWRFGHDGRRSLTKVEDPDGHVTRIDHRAGQPERIVDPLGRVTTLSVGRGGEVRSVAFDDGEPTSFEYDDRGRLTEQRCTGGADAHYTYDRCGRLIGIRAKGQTAVRRDEEGAIVSVHTRDGQTTIQRDAFGAVLAASTTTATGVTEVRYRYDVEGRLIRASRDGGPRFEARRDTRGAVVAVVLDDNAEWQMTRSPQTGRIEAMTTPAASFKLSWDAAGRIAEVDAGAAVHTFAYRRDGLLSAYATRAGGAANDTANHWIRRNARGVVLAQEGPHGTVDSPHVDHQGRRYGLQIDALASVSHLWGIDGTIDRVAVRTERTFELVLGTQDGQSTVHCTEDTPAVAPPQPEPSDAGAIAVAEHDALHRPQRGLSGELLRWDEDRLVVCGSRLFVHDPDSGRRIAAIEGDRITVGDPLGVDPGAAPLCPASVTHQRLFPTLSPTVPAGPLALLRARFAVRVWQPRVRPVAGEHPWDPDAWTPDVVALPCPDPRLDHVRLMRLLSPLPLPPLRVPSGNV